MLLSHYHEHDPREMWIRLQHWFLQTPGQIVYAVERDKIASILPNIFGYHIVQLGSHGPGDFLSASRISHQSVFSVAYPPMDFDNSAAFCAPEALPIAFDSIDVVVMPHVLEFANDPHQILREVVRILVGEGHVLLVGFNPWSLWGISRAVLRWRDTPPWCGHFLGVVRIADWLRLLGCDILLAETFCFHPLMMTPMLSSRWPLIERLGSVACPHFGGIYVLLAKKRLVHLTPMKLHWRIGRRVLGAGTVEPTARAPLPKAPGS